MLQPTQYKTLLAQVDLSDQGSILGYAKHLEGMTFREVLDLDIKPADYNAKTYNSAKRPRHQACRLQRQDVQQRKIQGRHGQPHRRALLRIQVKQ